MFLNNDDTNKMALALQGSPNYYPPAPSLKSETTPPKDKEAVAEPEVPPCENNYEEYHRVGKRGSSGEFDFTGTRCHRILSAACSLV